MVKKGYKHNTAVFGTDAECYVSQLFNLYHNPNGSRRPDLVSINGQYKPKLSIEVKSGKKMKGVMVDYQLHYAFSTAEDYRDLFGENPPQRKGLIPGLERVYLLNGSTDAVAYYYNLINRVDGLRSDELRTRYDPLRIQWGDQFLVPGDFGFYGFAIARHMRTEERMTAIIKDLHATIKGDLIHGESRYNERKSDPNSWQDLHARDVLAIHQNDDSLATEAGKRRLELYRKHYKGLANLQRVKIAGPNNTTIYALVEPRDIQLFDESVRKIVGERRSLLEQVLEERRGILRLLEGRSEEEERDDELLIQQSVLKRKKPIRLPEDRARRAIDLRKWIPPGGTPIGQSDSYAEVEHGVADELAEQAADAPF